MTALISPKDYTSMIVKLRTFFFNKSFYEVHTQNRLSILAACEDPTTVSVFDYASEIWPLPQTGQMWLEYELLKNPDLAGVFCVSTSYRQEQNPVKGRHELIFPMFEFEVKGNFDDLLTLNSELCTFLGFLPHDYPIKTYREWAEIFSNSENNLTELTHDHEALMSDSHPSGVAFVTKFPYHTSPFWNMKKDIESDEAFKCDVIMGGMETIGSAERATDPQEMRHQFHTISNGLYANLLHEKFGEKRVEEELDEFLNFDFFPRFGGGIGLTRLLSALQKNV